MDEMTDPVDPDDLSAEEEYEMKAAFGEDAVENGEVVQIDTDKLEPVPEKKWEMEEVLSEGDTVEIETRSGRLITGDVTEVDSISFKIDPDQQVSGYYAYSDFGGERGVCLELNKVNGEEVDVEYEPEIVG